MRVLKILVVISILTIIAFISFKLGYFSNRPPDTSAVESPEYREALKFIVDNMYVHKTRYGKLVAPDGNLTSFSPYDYKNLYAAIDVLDSLKLSHALVFVEEEDQRKISRKHLKDHIEGSLETWKNSRFSQHVEFKDFTEYILPYRAGNEILSDYRKTVPRLFSKISDSLNKIKTPKEAVNIINNNLKMRLVFDLRSHADLHEPDMLSLLSQKKGSCESLTQCTSLTMRAMGLAVAIDECPVWAHRNSGHQWNSFLDTNNKWIPFGGAEKNPDEFDAINDSVKAPKVFRHTFSVQENFGPPLENYNDIPQLFHNKTRIDVTKEYVDTLDVTIEITDNDLSPNDYLYLAVFNAEEWKIVSWAKLDKGKALFNDMGANCIVYMPVYYHNGETIPASDPFLLTPHGSNVLRPDLSSKNVVHLKHFNKFFDIIWNIGIPETDSKMELFFWKDQWVSCGVNKIGNERELHFTNVPEGALFWIKKHDQLNTWQRIFTLKNGEQTWY